MTQCTIKWRPSGGRGEWECVPAQLLNGKNVSVRVPGFGLVVPSETYGTISQGKPRLRKQDANNRSKLHLVPLVMALARLPDPAREDKQSASQVVWPLENKGFVVSAMVFEVAENSSDYVVLVPLYAAILHHPATIDLTERFTGVWRDALAADNAGFPCANAIQRHAKAVNRGINDIELRLAADAVIRQQTMDFGSSNLASIELIQRLPPTLLEATISGVEGRILTRLHSYRERDRTLSVRAKLLFKQEHGALFCECCGLDPQGFYGPRGEDRIEAHHRTPLEQLLPDTVTTPSDLAMVCPNCHDIIHAKRPWLDVNELGSLLRDSGHHYFSDSGSFQFKLIC